MTGMRSVLDEKEFDDRQSHPASDVSAANDLARCTSPLIGLRLSDSVMNTSGYKKGKRYWLPHTGRMRRT